MKSVNREPFEFKADANKTNPKRPKLSPRENRQADFQHFLAQGESINHACAFVRVTHSACEQWSSRHEGFPEAVQAARETRRQDILFGFHIAVAATAHSAPIVADRDAQPLYENPDKPDKPLQPNLAANHMRIQQLTPIKTPPEGPVEFFN